MNDKQKIDIIVGNNIKRERMKAGYTQDRFSEMVGIGTKSLSAIERGVVGISLTTLLRVCKVLSISSDTLLYDKTEQENNVSDLARRLERLTPNQYRIANDMLSSLLEAFALAEQAE